MSMERSISPLILMNRSKFWAEKKERLCRSFLLFWHCAPAMRKSLLARFTEAGRKNSAPVFTAQIRILSVITSWFMRSSIWTHSAAYWPTAVSSDI